MSRRRSVRLVRAVHSRHEPNEIADWLSDADTVGASPRVGDPADPCSSRPDDRSWLMRAPSEDSQLGITTRIDRVQQVDPVRQIERTRHGRGAEEPRSSTAGRLRGRHACSGLRSLGAVPKDARLLLAHAVDDRYWPGPGASMTPSPRRAVRRPPTRQGPCLAMDSRRTAESKILWATGAILTNCEEARTLVVAGGARGLRLFVVSTSVGGPLRTLPDEHGVGRHPPSQDW